MKKNYSFLTVVFALLVALFLKLQADGTEDTIGNPEDANVVSELQTKAKELRRLVLNLIDKSNKQVETVNLPIASETALGIANKISDIAKSVRTDEVGNDKVSIAKYLSKQLWQISEISLLTNKRKDLIESLPDILPCSGRLTSLFGYRVHPISRRVKKHDGLDISAPSGTPIVAPSQGVVAFSGRKGGYGNVVILDHGYGYQTLYGHASKLMVKQGQEVKTGDVIALVGSTGASTGPHLHYEVHIDGKKNDPQTFLPKNSFKDIAPDVLPLLAVAPEPMK